MKHKKLKISILGDGGISKAIQKIIGERGHELSSIMDENDPWHIDGANIVIEASVPGAVLGNVERLATRGKDMVIVTTGWYDQMDEMRKIIENHKVRAIWSPNFSIGVNLYFRIVDVASKLIDKAEEYDIWGTEIHHKNKVDSPSGTAKKLEKILLKNIRRKTSIVEDALQRKIEDKEIHFSSTRGGLVNFAHTIAFDSPADVIEIKHSARNRNAYALGAVKAAEWLMEQDPGFYSMEDFLADFFPAEV